MKNENSFMRAVGMALGTGANDLVRATRRGDLQKVKELAGHSDLNLCDNRGRLALVRAVYGGYVELVKFLLDAGADVNAKEYGMFGWSALIAAAATGNRELTGLLLQAGADVHVRSHSGLTALRWAKQGGYTQLALQLRSAGTAKDEKRILDFKWLAQVFGYTVLSRSRS